MGLFGGQVEQPPWIMTRRASCCVFRARITSETSRSARAYLFMSCVFFPVVLAPRQRSHLWGCFTVHSSGFSRGKIAPGTSFPFRFTFFSFNSTFRFAILSCFNPAETFHLGFRHVCLHSLPPSPPNNPINARAVWVPGYDFFEVSYFTLVVKGLKCSHRKMSANISPSKRLTAYSNHLFIKYCCIKYLSR